MITTPLDTLLLQLDSPEFQQAHRARLVAEARAARTSITYMDETGRCIQEWPATGERYVVELQAGGGEPVRIARLPPLPDADIPARQTDLETGE